MTDEAKTPRASRWRSAIAIAVVLGGAAVLLAVIFNTEPKAKRGGAVKRSAALVEAIVAESGAYRPRITTTGEVEAADDVILRPQVGGRVVAIADRFVPGGYLDKGAVALRIESADFVNIVEQRESELATALSELDVELGRSRVAAADYKLLDQELDADTKKLALREPQLAAMRQKVKAARATVRQAKLDVGRTAVVVPFEAHILSREVNVGSQLTPSTAIGRVVGVERYWVTASVPLAKLRWIVIPDDGGVGSSAVVRNRASWPTGAERDGTVSQMVGALGDRSRLARVIVTVEDPLARGPASGKPRLIIGEYLEVEIAGRELPSAVRLPRELVRSGDAVWIMTDEDKLEVRDVTVAIRDDDFAYITAGLKGGERVVVTDLASPRPGSELRLETKSAADGSDE